MVLDTLFNLHDSTILGLFYHSFSRWQALATAACYLLSQMRSVLFQVTDVWIFGTKRQIVFPWMCYCVEIYISQKSSFFHINANVYFFCEEQTAALHILIWNNSIHFFVSMGKERKRKGPELCPKRVKANCWLTNICPILHQGSAAFRSFGEEEGSAVWSCLEALHAVHMAWMQRAAGMPTQFNTN